MMVKFVRYLPKSEAAVLRCLHLFTEKGLFMSIFFTKVAGLQSKKRLPQRCFPVSLPNISEHFFAKHVWVVTTSAKYHSFFCCVELICKMLVSTLDMFRLSSNISRASTVSRSFWKSYTIRLLDLLLIKQAIRPKCRTQKQLTSSYL